MAMDPWDHVIERFRNVHRIVGLRPITDAMFRLIPVLRADPQLDGVEPNVSHASLTLRLPDVARYVLVEWRDEPPRGVAVAFVDPGLEIIQSKTVPEPDARATIVDYLAQLKPAP